MSDSPELTKAKTGIDGLDEVLYGGLPRGRPTLVTGGAGCGKTLLATEFLARGARDYGEPGLFISFEERPRDLIANSASLGFRLDELEREGRLAFDHVRVRREEIEHTGEYDLEALFVRIGHAADRIGAQRVVLDTVEALFAGLGDSPMLRSELGRLFLWLKDRELTAVITAEQGPGGFSRHGLEEYISDCVVFLDHRVTEQVSTRRLRVVKYRGTAHGTNEYPFLIDENGITVLPITSAGLTHGASDERVSSGVPDLDEMLCGGYFRGTAILVTGGPGTGKTSLGAHLADAACRRGERCLLWSFEESPKQMCRNMSSIGLDLQHWLDQDLLRLEADRATMYGSETHLARIQRAVERWKPAVMVIDPVTALTTGSDDLAASSLVLRLIDHLKNQGVTSLFTALIQEDDVRRSGVQVSSLVDCWLSLRTLEHDGVRERGMYVLKSRGTAHSNRLRRFQITPRGVRLDPPVQEPATSRRGDRS